MVRVINGHHLTPDEHLALVKDRVQELADQESPQRASEIVRNLAVDGEHAVLPSVPRSDAMGDDLVEGLMRLLKERGALVNRLVVCHASRDTTQEDWDEMTLESWMSGAA